MKLRMMLLRKFDNLDFSPVWNMGAENYTAIYIILLLSQLMYRIVLCSSLIYEKSHCSYGDSEVLVSCQNKKVLSNERYFKQLFQIYRLGFLALLRFLNLLSIFYSHVLCHHIWFVIDICGKADTRLHVGGQNLSVFIKPEISPCPNRIILKSKL